MSDWRFGYMKHLDEKLEADGYFAEQENEMPLKINAHEDQVSKLAQKAYATGGLAVFLSKQYYR